MNPTTFLLAFVFAGLLCPAFGQAPSSMEIYTAPTDLDLTLDPASGTAPGTVALKGTISGLFGQLSGVEVRFTSSPDLAVQPPAATPPATLASGTPVSVEVQVSPTKEKGEGSPWVKIHVTYLPDYAALIAHVKAGTEQYPNDLLREQLLAELEKMREKAEKVSAVVGHLFLTPPFTGQ